MDTPEPFTPGDLARALLDEAPDGVLAFDRAGRVTAWNLALARLTGVEAAAALGREVRDVVPWLGGPGAARRIRATLGGASPVGRARAVRMPGTGRGVRLDIRYRPVRAPCGAVVGGLARLRPLDGHDPAAGTRRRAEEALRRIKAAVDAAPVAIRIADATDESVYHNPAYEALFGYDADGLTRAGGPLVTFADRGRGAAILTAVESGRRWEGEVEQVARDGRRFCAALRADAIRDDAGRMVGLVAVCSDVGERRRAEAELDEREARLRGVVDNLPGVVVWRRVLHPDGRVAFPYYSTNGERVHGYSAAAIEADPEVLARMIHPDDRPGWRAAIEESAAHLRRFVCDFRVVTAWGDRRWFRSIATPRRQDDGGVVWDGVSLDVTELKETEAQLREHEAQLRGVVDNLPGVVWRRVLHPDGRITFPYYSTNGERIHGYSAAAVAADPEVLARMIHPDDRPGWRAAIEESAARLTRFACEFRVLTAWGEQRWFRAIATPRRQDDGAVVWDGITLDVTELKETEARLRALVENLPGTVWRRVLHPDGRLSYPYYSANAERVFGYPGEAIRADAGVVLRLIHPDHHAEWRAAVERSAATLTPFALDFRVTTGRGEGRWFRSMATPQRLPDGGVAWDGLVLDVTELKETEARLRERERQLNQAQQIAGLGDWRWAVGTDRETWSRQIYLTFGVDPEGFSPSHDAFLALVHPEDRGAVADAARRAVAAAGEYASEYRIRRPDGEVRHVRSEGRCELDEATGEVRALFGITQDVTEKKRAEALVRQAKEDAEQNARFLQTALESISEGLALYDSHNRLVICNDTYRRLFRESAEMLRPGMGFEDLIRARAEQGLTPAAKGRVDEWVRERMARFPYPSGPSEREFPGRGWWQMNEQRSRDGGVVQVVTDITPLKQREAELRASERRFRDFAESASDWLWETDAEGRLVFLSDRFREITGDDPERHLGKLIDNAHADPAALDELHAHLVARRPFKNLAYRYRLADGRWIVCQINGRPVFDERGVFRGHRGTATDVTERVEAEERIRHLARHDVLTGLPNRVLFADRLEQALAAARRDGGTVAVLSLDLNDFKGVNDTLGHAAGDELLRQVADRLRDSVREVDTVARLGGDEFAVIQVGVEGFGAAAALARRLLLRLAEPYRIEGQELHAAASIGITLYPEDGETQTVLLRNADLALYRAKAEGGRAFQFFLPEMNDALQHRRRLEQDLRRALEEGQFALHYHPQIDLATGRIVGVEGLLRWPHPERGAIAPAAFIPIAEECGLILPLGRWVLHEACRQARAWRDAGLPEVRIAVNLSPVQFAQADVADEVQRALRESGVAPERLELEITEGTLMRDTEAAIGTLRRLHDLGVVLALDDFGTGYSSLSYLRRFPLHRVKIDRSFVHGVGEEQRGDAIIAGAIITLGHALGLEVVAEGVETARQLAYLCQQGCDHAQGFYFSPPLSAAACGALLAEGAAPPGVADRLGTAAARPAVRVIGRRAGAL